MLRPNQFIFNDRRSFDDMGLIITERPPRVVAERDGAFQSVPGRNGDLYIDNGAYKNIQLAYKCALWRDGEDLEKTLSRIAVWLGKSVGYKILTDTYDPMYFRYAAVSGALSFDKVLREIGTGTLTFNCKPFLYSFDGLCPVEIKKATTSLFNPEELESVPDFKIHGSGNITLMINNSTFLFESVENSLDFDGENMDGTKNGEPQNEKIKFKKSPILVPGENKISYVGNVQKIEVIPRWRTL